jgi:hypothetical protein
LREIWELVRSKKTPQPLESAVGGKSEAGHLDVLASLHRGLVQSREGAGRTGDQVFDGLEQEDAAGK